MSDEAKIDKLVELVSAMRIDMADLRASTKARFDAYDENIRRFWDQRWPRLEKDVDHLSSQIASLETRLSRFDKELALTKVRVGFWGGMAGIGAALWAIIRETF